MKKFTVPRGFSLVACVAVVVLILARQNPNRSYKLNLQSLWRKGGQQNQKVNKQSKNTAPEKQMVEKYDDASTALGQWYFDKALVASVTASLQQHTPLINETLKSRPHQMTIVATVWCNNNTFQFKHALSILSAIHTVKPDLFQIYYNTFPRSDEYNQWIQYILVNFPFFKLYQCSKCCSDGKPDIRWVEEKVITQKAKALYIHVNNVISLYGSDNSGNFNFSSQLLRVTDKQCSKVTQIQDNVKSLCYNMDKVQHFIPTDTWKCTTDLCASIRYYMYHNAEPVMYTPHTVPVIPRIAHYVYYSKDTIDFSFYMSILSLLYVGNFSRIYVHCDRKMTGKNWNSLMEHQGAKEKVRAILRYNTGMVYGQKVNQIQHCSDTGKIDVLYKYGGVVVDPDLMLINEISSDLFHCDAVMNYDMALTKPFPDRLNLGFTMARPESVFARIWRESMRNYFDKKWLWNSGEIPYKIVEYNPYLAKISHHLQVMVSSNRYRPSWLMSKGFKHNINKLEEWRNLTLSFHYVHPSPFGDLKSVWTQKGMTGEVGRFILQRAGIKRK